MFNESEFEKVKDTVSLLFKKVLFFSTKTEYEEKPMYVIQVSGTSDLGAEIIEQIDCESDLNKMLSIVYINGTLSSQKCEQSVFICTPDESDKNLPDFDESINELFRNKYFNSFDVSALTLAECEKCELLRKITYKKGKSFILTEQLYDDIQLKRFFG